MYVCFGTVREKSHIDFDTSTDTSTGSITGTNTSIKIDTLTIIINRSTVLTPSTPEP
jgi:hypothetical protein